jgi:hypothetical protein
VVHDAKLDPGRGLISVGGWLTDCQSDEVPSLGACLALKITQFHCGISCVTFVECSRDLGGFPLWQEVGELVDGQTEEKYPEQQQ